MGYYPGLRMAGDYYPGRRQAGDFWGTLGKIGGTVLKGIGGFATGGLAGAATSVITSFASQGRPKIPVATGMPAPVSPSRGIPLPGPWRINPLDMLPGGAPGITREGGSVPPGWHLDKKTGTYAVRNRKMNPANPRALRRAIRREKRFVALARTVLKGTGIHVGRTPSFARKKTRR